MRKLYSLLLLLITPLFMMAQFTTNADAVVSTPCGTDYHGFRLTTAELYKKGSVFNNTLLNLNQSFELNTKLYFGTLDGGADGIAFVLQAEGTNYIGNDGAGLGYHRFNGPPPMPVDNPGPVPSFIVEFDTWQNDDIFGQNVGDPIADHVGFMSNSNAYHTSPTTLKAAEAFTANIEDGQWHDVRFSWNATSKTMTVSFVLSTSPLTVQTFTYTGDIVNTIFGGNAMVYWGFTASTGSWNPNEHMVCIHMPVTPPPVTCGQLRTQTPGGWGATPQGNNPGRYLHNNFAAAFPAGLVVGVTPNFHAKFSTAQSITDYLPAGGQAKALTMNYLNPSTNALKNTLVSHLVALSLSVRFDEVDPAFGPADAHLGAMIISSGAFQGWTVNNFLMEANRVLGGATSSYTVQQVLETASNINENYVDGNSNRNFLNCPGNNAQNRRMNTAFTEIQAIRALPNPSTGRFDLQYSAASGTNAQVLVMNSNGILIERKIAPAGNDQVMRLDLSRYPSGIYYVKFITDSGEQVKKLVVQK